MAENGVRNMLKKIQNIHFVGIGGSGMSGIAEVLICGEKKSTWKEQERKEYVVKASKSRVFRISKCRACKI